MRGWIGASKSAEASGTSREPMLCATPAAATGDDDDGGDYSVLPHPPIAPLSRSSTDEFGHPKAWSVGYNAAAEANVIGISALGAGMEAGKWHDREQRDHEPTRTGGAAGVSDGLAAQLP